jgi:hypothetical protein
MQPATLSCLMAVRKLSPLPARRNTGMSRKNLIKRLFSIDMASFSKETEKD